MLFIKNLPDLIVKVIGIDTKLYLEKILTFPKSPFLQVAQGLQR